MRQAEPLFWILLLAGFFLVLVGLLVHFGREQQFQQPVATRLKRGRAHFVERDQQGYWVRVPFRMVVCHGFTLGAALAHAARATFWCLVVVKVFPWAWDFGTRDNWMRFTSGQEKN